MAENTGLMTEVAVVGAGPAGLLAAIALAAAGIDTVLIGRRAPEDHRTTALMAGSVTALETLGVWPLCRDHAAALKTLRIADATARLLRAPEARFTAAEIDLPAFAHNIENRHLVAAMEARAEMLPTLRRLPLNARAVTTGQEARIALDDDSAIAAQLVIGADGARSLCRAAAGIATRQRPYPQHALTYNIGHARAHGNVSTEFHTEAGPFTLVPLPGLRSSVICVVDPPEAEDLHALDDEALSRETERRSHFVLGKVSVEPGRGLFPLAAETAETFARARIALVGEAAHRVPPIGAQGLNLGLRDAATIAELVTDAVAAGRDPGGEAVLSRYDTMRASDVRGRTIAIDLLNRSLLSGFLPVQGARGLGLYLLNRIGPLRRAVMREGIAPQLAQPRLMRGDTLP
ncbi:MAG: UbiH/UbiF family hydroxylase [Pseudorhodoplanes sp.]|nr:2-octaprenyl-6-methoxyphenol hydroxylase [Pseudorhodoplanes sp.]MBW7949837.1 UbiH/UbiF family hydroxylase [Pseudorhodoplanes sp.]